MALEYSTGYEKKYSCCFTGHRMMSDKQVIHASEKLETVISQLYEKGIKIFISGGALGFDMVASITVINMKTVYRDINIILALPCYDHMLKWQDKYINHYNEIYNRCDKIIYVTDNYYTQDCMYKRDKFMVDNSRHCIAWYNGKKRGGTYYTINYAEQQNKNIINIY